MLYHVFITAMTLLKDIMSVVGAVGAVGATIFGIWLALRKRAETKRQQERKTDVELSGKFARLETQVDHLQTAADGIERQYIEFRDRALRDQKELVAQIDELRTRCSYHQQASDVQLLQQEVRRLKERLERIDKEFVRYRDLVVEKTNYQTDLVMLTKMFDDLRQSLRDVHLILNKRSR